MSNITISSSQELASIEQYWETGYLHIRQVFTPAEVARFQQEVDRLTANLTFEKTPQVPLRRTLSGTWVQDRLDPVLKHSCAFQSLAQDARIQRWVTAILQDRSYLFKDKLILKPPGTSGYGLHQDYAYYQWTNIPPEGLLSVQISIDATFAENGGIILYPGLHHQRLPAPQDNSLDVAVDAVVDRPRETMQTDAGDIILFHSLTPHCSEFNRTDAARRTLYLSYSAQRYGNQYANYYHTRERELSKANEKD